MEYLLVLIILLVLFIFMTKNSEIITLKSKQGLFIYDDTDNLYFIKNPSYDDYEALKVGHSYKVYTYLFRIIYSFEEI